MWVLPIPFDIGFPGGDLVDTGRSRHQGVNVKYKRRFMFMWTIYARLDGSGVELRLGSYTGFNEWARMRLSMGSMGP